MTKIIKNFYNNIRYSIRDRFMRWFTKAGFFARFGAAFLLALFLLLTIRYPLDVLVIVGVIFVFSSFVAFVNSLIKMVDD